MSTIGIIIDQGVVQRVVSDDPALQRCNVVIVQDGTADKLYRPSVDEAITAYVKAARANTVTYGLGVACELAAERFEKLSRESHESPETLDERIDGLLGELAAMREQAWSCMPPSSASRPATESGPDQLRPFRKVA